MASYNLGKNGTLSVNGTSYKASKCEVKVLVDAVDCSNTESSGYRERMDGLFDMEITVEGPYDTTDDPFGTGGFNVGAKLTSVVVANSVGSQTIATMTSALVVDVSYDNPVEGRCGYKVTLRSDGSYTSLMK